MSRYTRRPILAGNTDSDQLGQPYIIGRNSRDSNGEFPSLTLPAELRLETESGGPTSVVFNTDQQLSTLVDEINAAMAGLAEAEDRGGALLIRTLGTGEGSFIRVHPQILAFTDASFELGFHRHPNPLATVSGGDQGSSPPRPTLQQNGQGTAFLAFGEDRVASAYNRALQKISSNADYLFAQVNRTVGVATIIDVEPGVFWDPRLHYDGDGELDQVDLSGIPELNGARFFVGGGLTNASSLDEIAQFFTIVDSDNKEMLRNDVTVRIGAVTRGLRPGSPPAFPDEKSPPTASLPNTSGASPDGLNALGVNRTKATEAITQILDKSTVLCAGATFVTDGVVAGDPVTLSGATINYPFNHNGNYVVETVVSEEELVLRGAGPTDRGELNEDSGGTFGTLTITNGGDFEHGIFVSFVPPIPRFPPASGGIRIILGTESALGSLGVSDLVQNGIRSAEEVDAYVQREIQRKLTLGGVYNGPGGAQLGGGFYAKILGRPFLLEGQAPRNAAAGSSVRSGTGAEILSGHVLHLASPDEFTTADEGRVVRLTGLTYDDEEPFVIEQVLDPAHAKLAPYSTSRRAQDALPTGSPVAWEIFDGSVLEHGAGVSVVAQDGSVADGGFVYEKRHSSSGLVAPTYGQSLTHLERVKLTWDNATNISEFDVTLDGTNFVETPFSPTAGNYHIAPEEGGDLLPNQSRVGSLLRIHNGPSAGWYRIQYTRYVGIFGRDGVEVLTLDGGVPVLLDPGFQVRASVYNIHFGTNVTMRGDRTGATHNSLGTYIYHDILESGEVGESAALGLNWRGDGAGLWMRLNDSVFRSSSPMVGARGPAIRIDAYAPADGILITVAAQDDSVPDTEFREGYGLDIRAFTNEAWFSEEGTGYEGFASFVGRFVQNGRDPGLIVARTSGTDTSAPSFAGFSEPAALKVASAVGLAGVGSAIHMVGSLYQERKISDVVEWDHGGIFTETAGGMGRFLYPLQSNDHATEPYYGVEVPSTDFELGTQLGHPGQILPASGSTGLAAELYGRNYSLANYPHALQLKAAAFSGSELPERFVGCRVLIEGGSHDGDEFFITGVIDSGARLVLSSNTVVPLLGEGAGPEIVTFLLLGQRWHKGYVNIANWTLIGTGIFFDPIDMPLLGLSSSPQSHTDFYEPIAYAPLAGSDLRRPEGPMNSLEAFPDPDGARLTSPRALAFFPNLAAANAAGYTDEWQSEVGEPRSPFPNNAVFISGTQALPLTFNLSYLDRTTPGNLQTDGYHLQHVGTPAPLLTSARLVWSEAFGGSLLFEQPGPFAGVEEVETIRIWKKGSRVLSTQNFRVVSRLWLALDGYDVQTVTVKLVASDNAATVLASQTHVITQLSLGRPSEVVSILEFSDLHNRAADHHYEGAGKNDDFGYHLVLEFSANNGVGANPLTVFRILKWEAEHGGERALISNGLDVVGALRANNFRHTSPARGFQTVTPLDVDLLNKQDFARLLQSETDEEDQEGTGLGAIFDASPDASESPGGESVWWQPYFSESLMFKKGPHNAAIRLYHPYYDPLWYFNLGANHVSDSYVPCGRTGFMGPLDPPHGSRLTGFYLALSLSPCQYKEYGVGGYASDFCIYHTDRSGSNKAVWDAETGYKLKIWRYHTVDFHVYMTENVNYSGDTPEMGYSEVIYEEDIDVNNSGPPTMLSNGSQGNERFSSIYRDLRNLIVDEEKRLVDRRHFGYFFTVEFYGGPRRSDGTDYEYRSSTTPAWEDVHQHVLGTRVYADAANPGQEWRFSAVRVRRADENPDEYNLSVPHPPTVKFRGARLTWYTDRISHGGWGG